MSAKFGGPPMFRSEDIHDITAQTDRQTNRKMECGNKGSIVFVLALPDMRDWLANMPHVEQ